MECDVDRLVGRMVYLGANASPQFGGNRGFLFTVLRVLPWTTMNEWVWLEGMQMPRTGSSRDPRARKVFVRRAALRPSWPARSPYG